MRKPITPASISAGHYLHAGKRYVFFRSLENYNGTSYAQNKLGPVYAGLAKLAQGYANAANAQFNIQRQSPDTESVEMMKSYLNLIKQLAETERANELEFVHQFKNFLKDDALKELTPLFEQYLDQIDKNFDYETLLGLINKLMDSNDDLMKRRREIIINNGRVITDKINAQSEAFQKELEDAHEKYQNGKYRGMISQTLKTPIKDTVTDASRTFTTQITELFTRKFNSIMSNLTTDETLKRQLIYLWENDQWRKEDVRDLIIDVAVNVLLNKDINELTTQTGAEMAKDIADNFTTYAKKYYQDADATRDQNFRAIISTKTTQTLEEVALTTRRGLGQMYKDLTNQERINIAGQYGVSFEDEIETLKNLADSEITDENEKLRKKILAKITKQLGAAIREKASQTDGVKDYLDALQSKNKDTRDKIINQLKKSYPDFFQQRELQDYFKKYLSIKLYGYDIAEFFNSEEVRKKIIATIEVMGKSVQLKTDIGLSLSYTPIKNISEHPGLQQLIESLVNNWTKDFMNLYKKEGQGAVDVQAANLAFQEMLKQTSDAIEDLAKQSENAPATRAKALEALSKFLHASISVKEYTYGNNKFGFDGGSLGKSSSKIIDNIDQMYNLGGITNYDKDLLYYAVINCGVDGFVDANTKENIELFLLAGAAMLMFDDGFASIQKYMELMIANFGFMPKLLHLYKIQGGYTIPASYVYTMIYENLTQVYADIINTTTNSNLFVSQLTKGNNKVDIVNRITEEKDKPNWQDAGMDLAQTRWDTMKDKANSKDLVDIRFSFLGGFLDILDGIPKAFNISGL